MVLDIWSEVSSNINHLATQTHLGLLHVHLCQHLFDEDEPYFMDYINVTMSNINVDYITLTKHTFSNKLNTYIYLLTIFSYI